MEEGAKGDGVMKGGCKRIGCRGDVVMRGECNERDHHRILFSLLHCVKSIPPLYPGTYEQEVRFFWLVV